jgi:hypothetical protein
MDKKAQWALRLGLGLMYVYSGYDLIAHPTAWTWALPPWAADIITGFVPLTQYLRIQGVVELILAAIFILPFFPRALVKIAAVISVLEMVGILILAFFPFQAANFSITFRDLGLLGALLALFMLVSKPQENSY